MGACPPCRRGIYILYIIPCSVYRSTLIFNRKLNYELAQGDFIQRKTGHLRNLPSIKQFEHHL